MEIFDSSLLEELIKKERATSSGPTSYLMNSISRNSSKIVKGRNSVIYDTDDRQIIDLGSQTANCILGQNDKWVSYRIAANILSEYPTFLSSKFSSYYYSEVPKKLVKLLDLGDKVVNHRQNNGTDAVELAIKSAVNASNKIKLMSFKGSYHGQSLATYHASYLQQEHTYWETDNVVFIDTPPDMNDINREQKEHEVLASITRHIDECFGVILEPIQVNNNVIVPSKSFFKQLDALCKKSGVPLIFDEVQTGFGWLGHISAASIFDINPEFIAFGKALTAGYGPMSVLVADRKYDNLEYGTSEKTNGADIRSLVATTAVIERLYGVKKDELPNNINNILKHELNEGLIKTRFSDICSLLDTEMAYTQDEFGDIVDCRGMGLIRGIALKPNSLSEDPTLLVKKIQTQCINKGLFVRVSGRSVLIKPAVNIEEEFLKDGFKILRDVMRGIL